MNAIYIAQAAANQQGDPMSMLITFGLIGVIFYFLLIRPQRKQQKELKDRQDALKPGDKVVSAGGKWRLANSWPASKMQTRRSGRFCISS